MRRPIRSLLAATLLTAGSPAAAGIGSDLGNFFDTMGYSTNVTPSGAYQGQTAGYYTGGSVVARAPVRNYQIASIQMPRIRAGCGGIDAFAGAYSFINSDQLTALFADMGANATGLLWQLALSVLSEKLSGKIQDFENLANFVNSANINSCEAAAVALGGFMGKSDVGNQVLCNQVGSSIAGDWASRRMACGKGGEQPSVLAGARDNPEFKDLLLEGNVVWRALKKLTLTANDPELAELMMSMTGTVIIPLPSNDGPSSVTTIPPATNIDSGWSPFLYGGAAYVHKCDDGTGEFDCTVIKQNELVTIREQDGYAVRVQAILAGMVERILNEDSLTNDQLNLLAQTSLPVYKMLNVATAYSPAYADRWAQTYADAIAIDLLYQYFGSLTDAVAQEVGQFHLQTEIAEKFNKQIGQTRLALERSRSVAIAKVSQTIEMMQESMTIERMLISGMSPGLAGSYQWSRGMR